MITLLSAGSRGDTQPYLALGLELKKTGQEVRMATFENYADFVRSFGLEFYPIHGDVTQFIAGEGGRQARQADSPLKIFLSFNQLKSHIFDLQQEFYTACLGSDAIVYHPGVPIGYFIAQQLKIPSIFAPPFPMTPTRDFPALIFYDAPRLGKGFNLLSHKIFEKIMWSTSSAAIQQFWRQEFGVSPKNFGSPYGRQVSETFPTVISCSNYVFPKPADWPEHVYNTGYWFLDDEPHWRAPDNLLEFLQDGPPPVYVGFGSLSDPDLAGQVTQVVAQALRLSGQRGILATGWGGMANTSDLAEDIFVLESAPHALLFPRMAAVAHHGGAGTTAAGLRAGVPSIIIPHSNDQFAWGRRVYELGVGPKPIKRAELTSETLAVAFRFAARQEVVAAAQELGKKIFTENGAQAAAGVILNALK
jgi:sterol 3beta-glucosyltransferase